MNEENVAIRLKVFMDEMGLTNSQFADQCGIPRPSVSQLLSGRNKKISDVIIGQIHTAFPDLSVLWLLFGEGAMTSSKGDDVAAADGEAKTGDETEKNPTGVSGEKKYSNLVGLELTENVPSGRMNKENTTDKKTVELMNEIEKLRKNPRKVSQITVYYDDSTFETFYPASAVGGKR